MTQSFVGQCVLVIDADRFLELFFCLSQLSLTLQGYSFTIIRSWKIFVNLYRFFIVLDSLVKLFNLIIDISQTVISYIDSGVYLNGLLEKLNCSLMHSFFSINVSKTYIRSFVFRREIYAFFIVLYSLSRVTLLFIGVT